jgi:PAS domain S-box-containing protein
MLWLYLLGAVTFLIIALRRVLRRQRPLKEELFSARVVMDHVQSGVAWIYDDGKIGSTNKSLSDSLGVDPSKLKGTCWLKLFAEDDRERVTRAYSEMLLQGKSRFEAIGLRADLKPVWFDVLLIAAHDHSMRFAGHHCLLRDCTREHQLAERLHEMEHAVATGR